MTEFWKSTPKHWCEACEMFVTNNASQRKRHDTSTKHVRNVERQLHARRRERMAASEMTQPRGPPRSHGSVANWRDEGKKPSEEQKWAAELRPAPEPKMYDPSKAGEEEEDDEEEEEEGEKHSGDEEQGGKEDAGAAVDAPPPMPDVAYDPLNPYGKWVEASPPRGPVGDEDEDDKDGTSHKSRRELEAAEDERWAEDVLEDADSDFEIKKLEAPGLKRDPEEEDRDGIAEEISFKQRKRPKGGRNARHKDVQRDINE